MPVLYAVTGNGLLSQKAHALDPGAFEAQQLLAERLLGLVSPAITGSEDVETVKLAVVMQMNFQIEQGLTPLIMSSVSSAQSKQTTAYRDRFLNPMAVGLLRNLSVWWEIFLGRFAPDLRSVRYDESTTVADV